MIRDGIDIAIAKLAIWSLNRGYGYCREREQQPLLSEDRCAACAASDVQDPGRVRVKLNKNTFPYTIGHYEFTLDGKLYRFEPYQILHIKYPDPGDPYVGVGVPQTIPTWIDADNYAMEYNRKFFINGAQVGMYIQTETNVEANIDRIRKGFENRYAGNENAHKTPVLPKGAKLEHTGVTHRDMDFSTLTDATRDRILAGYRVSKTILGTAESDTNRATAETADYVFSKRTIKPKMLLIVSYLIAFVGRGVTARPRSVPDANRRVTMNSPWTRCK